MVLGVWKRVMGKKGEEGDVDGDVDGEEEKQRWWRFKKDWGLGSFKIENKEPTEDLSLCACETCATKKK